MTAPLKQESPVVEVVDTAAEPATRHTGSVESHQHETITRAQQQLAGAAPEQTVEELLLTSASDFTEPAELMASALLVPSPSFDDEEWSMGELHPHLAYTNGGLGWSNTRGSMGLMAGVPFAGGGGSRAGSSSSSSSSSSLSSPGGSGGELAGRSSGVPPGAVIRDDHANGDHSQNSGGGDQGTNNGGGDGGKSYDKTPGPRVIDSGDSPDFPDESGPRVTVPGGSDSTPVTVPEPASLVLTGIGFAGFLTARRRRSDR